MGGVSAARRRAFSDRVFTVGALGALTLALGSAQPAGAVEALDGRLQAHGYFEQQIRSISKNFNQNLDLTQWASILNIELEADILGEDSLGPLSALSAFVRVEARYDCVWTRACGLFPSADVYGDRAGKLPPRLGNAEAKGYSGAIEIGPTTERLGANRNVRVFAPQPGAGRRVGSLGTVDGFATLLGSDGFDNVLGSSDDPALYTFATYSEFRYAMRKIGGPQDGIATQTLGPWLPKNHITPVGALRDRANPFRGTAGAVTIGCNPFTTNPALGDCSPIVPNPTNPPLNTIAIFGNTGSAALPFRPAPFVGNLQGGNQQNAQGIYYPSQGLRNWLKSGNAGNFDQNFSQNELAWNRGASQTQTKELREAYLDSEFFDGRLFLRTGRQTIVWGKTELFPTTDQFNPRDLALSTLSTLEESRIGQWAVRGILSLYNIGPLEDVRLEGAVNLDTFEPDDLGKCGEPYAPNPVCDKSYGLFAHGASGVAIAGEQRPPHWWDNAKGLQGGARIEFRWDRFSFAVVDIYSYNRLPNTHRIWTYSRNVDPVSGRPRRAESTGPCPSANVLASVVNQPLAPDCLGVNPLSNRSVSNSASSLNPTLQNDVLNNTSVNQQLFAMICSTTVGFAPTLDPTACAQSVFNSTREPLPSITIANALMGFLEGSSLLNIAFVGLATPFIMPTVQLSVDPRDITPGSGLGAASGSTGFLSTRLTVEQEALLGCGPYYGYGCDSALGSVPPPGVVLPNGFDLLNAEASALMQSFVGFEGTTAGWSTLDASRAQPGTVGFRGGSPCTRNYGGKRKIVVLPGCRGPTYNSASFGGPNDYDPNVDGNVIYTAAALNGGRTGVLGFDPAAPNPFGYLTNGHPFTGQTWTSEMAAFSWNLEMLLVANSTATAANGQINNRGWMDPAQPFSTTRCSMASPQLCTNVQSLLTITGLQRRDLRAAGNGTFGRRDFVWHSGGEVYLEYQKRNILGLSMDFAEDVTKSNWGIETAWIQGLPFNFNDRKNNVDEASTYNLTVSIDRPTFINFLNANRTFFFNAQLFFQYIDGYTTNFTTTGPWNFLGTFTISTGYFQDRLLPSVTFIYDVESTSGGALPQIQYRFTENFSATFGMTLFFGRSQYYDMPINPISTVGVQQGVGAYKVGTEQGLSVVRDRDEVFLKLRYTF